MKKNLINEYDLLDCVIVHRPDVEHLEMTPKNLNSDDKENYLLFDDIIDLRIAQKEHDYFTNIIKKFTGSDKCLELNSLLNDISKDFHIDLTNPLPNIMFTRDLGVSIGNSMIITWASNKVRNPENIIAKYIIKNHALFSESDIYDFHKNHPDLALEGGDVTLINEEVIAIGIGERTSKESVEAIAPFLYKNGIKYIMCFNMPEERRFMHLDTLFSIISNNEAIVYPPFFEEGSSQELKVDIIKTSSIEPFSISTLKASHAFKEVGLDINFIHCGGNSSVMQEREQWTDGANAFCLAPGIIILYDRNPITLLELEKHNYKKISANDFLALDNFDRNQKTVITIESGELSRGRVLAQAAAGAYRVLLPREWRYCLHAPVQLESGFVPVVQGESRRVKPIGRGCSIVVRC